MFDLEIHVFSAAFCIRVTLSLEGVLKTYHQMKPLYTICIATTEATRAQCFITLVN